MPKFDDSVITDMLRKAGVPGFKGTATSLGGGEVNDTYKLDCGDARYILRVAKDEGQHILRNEAESLRLITSERVPTVIYFDESDKVDGRSWILESYVPGTTPVRLTQRQFMSLGSLLAEVHQQKSHEIGVNLLGQFLASCTSFGNKEYLLNHPLPDPPGCDAEQHTGSG